MGLRDAAIVAYAETKVMEESDRDIFELDGDILETLLDKTGVEKAEIDGFLKEPAWVLDDVPLFLPDFRNGDSEFASIEASRCMGWP